MISSRTLIDRLVIHLEQNKHEKYTLYNRNMEIRGNDFTHETCHFASRRRLIRTPRMAEFGTNLSIEAPNCKVYRNLLRLIPKKMRDTKSKDK